MILLQVVGTTGIFTDRGAEGRRVSSRTNPLYAYSNRRAPSRDMAIELGGQDDFKQRISGGCGRGNQGIGYKPVSHFVRRSSVLRNNLGWAGERFVVFSRTRANAFDLHSRLYNIIPLCCLEESSLSSVEGMTSCSCHGQATRPGSAKTQNNRGHFEVKYLISAKSNYRCHLGSRVL